MTLNADYKPEFESLRTLLLNMAQERSVEVLLETIVQRLTQRPHIPLARIWLTQPGDICQTCIMREDCPDRTYCLHLMASAGQPLSKNTDWTGVDDEFKRIPIGLTKIGHIASTGKPVDFIPIDACDERIAHLNWVQKEKIIGFGGQPLHYKWVVLGALGVFTRIRIPQEEIIWLRMIANHAGIAIANARAFGEIERLKKQLELENAYLREELNEARDYGDIVGQSPAISNILKQIDLVAPTNASVLILGDSGTGKELVAREIHKRSRRGNRPMIKVNCASIPRELYESEFFGHVKGAFTGAVNNRAGRFEAADGGTLFLDEVGEIPLTLQSKLLRVLQEGQYERVGEEITREVDVRIIASTNRNLTNEIEKKRFRQDLYYRLNVFPVKILPLRKRKEDIPLLAEHFLRLIAGKMDRPVPRLTRANMVELQEYDWPGNVRELQNIIERAVITSHSGTLHFDLPSAGTTRNTPRYWPAGDADAGKILTEKEMRRRERENILAALRQSDWKIYGRKGAAELLGLKPTTLTARINKMGITKAG